MRAIWSELRHFKPAEFGAEYERMDEDLLRRLDRVRELAGVPMVVSSAWRSIPPGKPPEHGRGKAVDISCTSSRARMALVRAAIEVGFRRIGVYDRHLHFGVDDTLPQDVMWWDTSD